MGPQSVQRAKDQGESEPGALLAPVGGQPAAGVLNTGLMQFGVTLHAVRGNSGRRLAPGVA